MPSNTSSAIFDRSELLTTRKTDPVLEANKKLIRQHTDLTWNRGRPKLLAPLHTRDFYFANSYSGRKVDFQGFCETVEIIREAIPNLSVLTDDIIADHDKMASTMTFYGSVEKPVLGLPPSDRVLTLSAVFLWYLQRDRIRSLTTVFNVEEIFDQTGTPSTRGRGSHYS